MAKRFPSGNDQQLFADAARTLVTSLDEFAYEAGFSGKIFRIVDAGFLNSSAANAKIGEHAIYSLAAFSILSEDVDLIHRSLADLMALAFADIEKPEVSLNTRQISELAVAASIFADPTSVGQAAVNILSMVRAKNPFDPNHTLGLSGRQLLLMSDLALPFAIISQDRTVLVQVADTQEVRSLYEEKDSLAVDIGARDPESLEENLTKGINHLIERGLSEYIPSTEPNDLKNGPTKASNASELVEHALNLAKLRVWELRADHITISQRATSGLGHTVRNAPSR